MVRHILTVVAVANHALVQHQIVVQAAVWTFKQTPTTVVAVGHRVLLAIPAQMVHVVRFVLVSVIVVLAHASREVAASPLSAVNVYNISRYRLCNLGTAGVLSATYMYI